MREAHFLQQKSSVPYNNTELAERHCKSAAKKEKEVQYKFDKPNADGKMIRRICEDGIDFIQMAEESALLKNTPELEGKELECSEQWENEKRLHPAIRPKISIAQAMPVDSKNPGVKNYAPHCQ